MSDFLLLPLAREGRSWLLCGQQVQEYFGMSAVAEEGGGGCLGHLLPTGGGW